MYLQTVADVAAEASVVNPRKIMVPQPGFELGTHALQFGSPGS